MPVAAVGQSDVEDAIRQTILDQYAFGRENLRDSEGGASGDGSAEFWSTGGLLQQVPADTPLAEYVVNTLTPKHITVIVLCAEAAIVHMYVEGGLHEYEGWDGPVINRRRTQGRLHHTWEPDGHRVYLLIR